jgi:hypothetical protein
MTLFCSLSLLSELPAHKLLSCLQLNTSAFLYCRPKCSLAMGIN